MSWLTDMFAVMRKIDSLMQLERKHDTLISSLDERQRRAEAREEILVAKAEAAAATAASVAASQHVADLARRVGSLEERINRLERSEGPPRLPPGG